MNTFLKGILSALLITALLAISTASVATYASAKANTLFLGEVGKPLLQQLQESQIKTNNDISLMKKDICLILEYQRNVKVPKC